MNKNKYKYNNTITTLCVVHLYVVPDRTTTVDGDVISRAHSLGGIGSAVGQRAVYGNLDVIASRQRFANNTHTHAHERQR